MKTKQQIIWQPNPGPQTEALKCNEGEILYGGARGGGKTDAGIAWLLRWVNNPEYRFLVIRRNSGDLKDWIDRAKKMYKHLEADFVQGEVRFPSGAKGFFGHLHDADAYERYQGHEYQKILIEELTHIPTEELYLRLIGSCRSTVDGLKPQVFCTTNPGNVGHKWVKKRFVAPTKPGKRFTDPRGLTRIFIPAKVEDNPVLIKKDPNYINYLESLPAGLREAWREGSWESFEVKGAYYTKQIQEARQQLHVTKVAYETQLPVHTVWDLGVGDSTAIGFFQQYGNEIRMLDYYENSGEGLQFYAKILDEKGYKYGNAIMPHDINVRELGTGKSRKETAESLGIKPIIVAPMLPVDDGIQAVRMMFNRIWFDEVKCKDFLEALSQYRKEWDQKKNCFKNKPLHDWTSHAADMIRYLATSELQKPKTIIVHHGR